MRLFFTRVALALMIAATAYAPSFAGVVTFGSGANQFSMEFVTIGNPGKMQPIPPVHRIPPVRWLTSMESVSSRSARI
jgi:hypothetical protein